MSFSIKYNINFAEVLNFSFSLQASEYWVADLGVTNRDRVTIESGGMLGDLHIHAVHNILADQFPELEGPQPTLLSQTGSFTPVSECGGFLPEG